MFFKPQTIPECMDVVHGKEMDVGMAGWEVVGNQGE